MIISRKKRQFPPSETLPYIKINEGEVEVKLQSLDIEIKINGLYAETTQKMVFFNPNSRDLEGDLQFPMPDGAVVCGYALDIEGRMRDGVIVSKQKARMVLETEIRKGIDPGIMEQVMGNIYRTRIYPIPAKGTRQVNITYTSDLTIFNNSASFHLPLKHASEIDQVKLKIEVIKSHEKPEISGGNGNLSLTDWQNKWVSEAVLQKGAMLDDLRIELPDLPEQLNMIEETEDKEIFFCISNRYENPKETNIWKPERISIIWDASGSRENIKKDIEFLNGLFVKWEKLIIDLIVFRNKVDSELKSFNVKNGKSDVLITYLKQLAYDGGTDISDLDLNSLSVKAEAFLFFSDGLQTIKSDLPAMSNRKLFTISSSANSNSVLLKHISRQSGGSFIDLQRISISDGINIISDNSKTVQILDSKGCSDLYFIPGQKRFIIIGKLIESTGILKLSGLVKDEIIEIDKENSIKGRILSKAWAGFETDKLSISVKKNKENILSIGIKYGIVTSGSSLIVLDSFEQYIEHGIEPPESLPELRDQYNKTINRRKNILKKEKNRHIDKIADMWKERIKWWEKEYPKSIKKTKPEYKHSSALPPEQNISINFDEEEISGIHAEVNTRRANIQLRTVRGSRAQFSDSEPESPVESSEPEVEESMNSISIDEWNPDTPYLKAIKKLSNGDRYKAYLIERDKNKNSPSFFLDCGDLFLKEGQNDKGIRILTNLLELSLDDVSLKRMFAWRMQQAGEIDTAIEVFRDVKNDRNDEPQSYRDLALALEERWLKEKNDADIIEAVKLFYDVILKEWERFPEIELIVLMELNRTIHLAKKTGFDIPEFIDKRLVKHLDLDMRIAMSWDADLTDVDLHVFEPTEEHAYYGHNRSTIGGLVSKDFTQGYGPEEYLLREAVPGTYKIKAHYYGSHQQKLFGGCTVIVTLFTDYGRDNEVKKVLTLRLDKPGDDLIIGEVNIDRKSENKKADLFITLKSDMSMDEVIKIIGHPDKIKGSGDSDIEIIYKRDSRLIQIVFSPKLVSVKQIMDGAEFKIL